MALNTQSYLKAAYPPPLHLPTEQPTVTAPADFRRFTLRWNSRKVKGTRRRSDEWQECQGVLFSAGCVVRVALSNGQTFPTQDEMENLLELGGDYTVEFIDA